jgi:hypothetical protein
MSIRNRLVTVGCILLLLFTFLMKSSDTTRASLSLTSLPQEIIEEIILYSEDNGKKDLIINSYIRTRLHDRIEKQE